MNSKIVIFTIALVLGLVDFGSCIKCYHCDSQKDPKCAQSFTSAVPALECASQESRKYIENNLMTPSVLPGEIFGGIAGDPSYCHKIVFETGTVVRTCLIGKAKKDEICKIILANKISTPGSKVKTCDVCDQDGCNGAGSLSVSLPLSIVAFIACYLLYKQ